MFRKIYINGMWWFYLCVREYISPNEYSWKWHISNLEFFTGEKCSKNLSAFYPSLVFTRYFNWALIESNSHVINIYKFLAMDSSALNSASMILFKLDDEPSCFQYVIFVCKANLNWLLVKLCSWRICLLFAKLACKYNLYQLAFTPTLLYLGRIFKYDQHSS